MALYREVVMNKHSVWKAFGCFLSAVALLLTPMSASLGQGIPKKEEDAISVQAMSKNASSILSIAPDLGFAIDSDGIDARGALSRQDLEGLCLYPGGMPFGIKFFTEGVSVVGFCDVETGKGKVNPATQAGLRQRDVILRVNGNALSGASDLNSQIEGCQGNALKLGCKRGKEELELTLTPAWCEKEGRYKAGILVRDSGAGIGTVTFILPETGAFAGLGHGICDAETGALVEMRRGNVSDVTISSVVKGAPGAPGELKGYFNAGKVGTLLGNSSCGVWGLFTDPPECQNELMPVGLREDLQEGDAYILCTLDTNKMEKYDVKISGIKQDAKGSKCFTVTVTDEDLIAASGGIVQGMSGSPIIQNGKIVGAVTHVLVGDPTTGYGIFLENMLVNMPLMARS